MPLSIASGNSNSVALTLSSAASSAMAWGAAKGVDSLINRLQNNDPTLTSLHLFQGKQFGNEVCTYCLAQSHKPALQVGIDQL